MTFIDLFSGCGGFSLGMERAGVRCLAAIDFDAEAVTTFQANFPHVPHVPHVLGILSAAKGKFFTLVQSEARALGYRVHAQVEEAWKLGVPQKRRRQLIVGVRNDIPGWFRVRSVRSCVENPPLRRNARASWFRRRSHRAESTQLLLRALA